MPDLPLFEAEADKAVRIFNRLRIPDVPGTPRFVDATGDWFRAIVRALFGSYDEATGQRMIQEVFLLVPKKNSKSTSAAGVMVTAAIMTRRPEAEFLLIAPTKEIADISFRQAAGMIKADPALAKLFHPQRHVRTITHKLTGTTIQIKAADTDTITGVKATGILVDETHVFAQKARAADVFVEIRGALAARPDGFMFQISTQSKTPPAGVFLQELRRARKVRDGKRDMPLLPVIYELPKDMAAGDGWKDPKTFPLVNPNLGRSVSADFLLRELQSAEDVGAEAVALFASQHLNVEIGLALQSDRWAGADHWDRHADPALTLEAVIDRCEVVVVGIDGGGLDDLLGLAVLGRETGTRRWLLWSHAWAHQCVLERRKEIAPRLLDFKTEGTLSIIPDDSAADVESVADIVEQVGDAGLLPGKSAIGVDPVGIKEIVDELERRGFSLTTPDTIGQVTAISQNWTLSNTIKTTERTLARNGLVHGGTALMAWCVGNFRVVPRGNAITITKQAAGSAKIDPGMAMFNAVALMSLNPESGRSVYEERGIRFA